MYLQFNCAVIVYPYNQLSIIVWGFFVEMGTQGPLCFLLFMVILTFEVEGEVRCTYENSNDPIFECTECLWTKGNLIISFLYPFRKNKYL